MEVKVQMYGISIRNFRKASVYPFKAKINFWIKNAIESIE